MGDPCHRICYLILCCLCVGRVVYGVGAQAGICALCRLSDRGGDSSAAFRGEGDGVIALTLPSLAQPNSRGRLFPGYLLVMAGILPAHGDGATPVLRETNSILSSNSVIVGPRSSWHNCLFLTWCRRPSRISLPLQVAKHAS